MVNPGGPHKNWNDTLNAYALYRARCSESAIRLVLAGSLHQEAEAIQSRITADPLLAESVSCLGYVGDAELRYLYSHACALIYPSRYEGFGRPILEAMIYGTPVIISDVPVLREVAGDAALAVPLDHPQMLAESLQQVEKDEDLRKTLGARSKQQVRKFSWHASAAATLNSLLALGDPQNS
jgi:glycosyltransferase involved in cell wall biosynthesis